MPRSDGLRRAFGYVIGLGTTALVLSPLVTGAADSFPISTFPMFASKRGQPVLYAVIGRAGDGSERRLEPALVGSKEVLQAKVLIDRSVAGGEATMAELCQATAARVAALPSARAVRSVEIVSRRYDPIEYFSSGPTPLEQTQLFHCRVPAERAPEAEGAP
jgi:hypothetical protein